MIPSKQEFFLLLIGINLTLFVFSLFLNSIEMAAVNIISIISFYLAYKIEEDKKKTKMNNLYFYKAIIRSVYDGDTLTADIDLGFGIWINGAKLRLDGVDTPELRGVSEEEKVRAIEARDWVREKTLDKEVFIKSLGKGRYGRYIVQIWTLEDDSESDITINDELVKLGMAEKY